MSVDSKKTKLTDMVSSLSESECDIFIRLIKNKQHVGLLERESEWLSTHHNHDSWCRHPKECGSCYSYDTLSDKQYLWRDLILAIFSNLCYEDKFC